jgi:hypothetical protein
VEGSPSRPEIAHLHPPPAARRLNREIGIRNGLTTRRDLSAAHRTEAPRPVGVRTGYARPNWAQSKIRWASCQPPAHHRVPNNGAFPAQSSDTSHISRRLRTASDHRRVALPGQAHSSAVPARIRLRRTRREPRRWCGKTCSVKHSGFGRHNGVAPGYRGPRSGTRGLVEGQGHQ